MAYIQILMNKIYNKIIETLKDLDVPVTVLLSTKWEQEGEIYIIVGLSAPKSVRGPVTNALRKANLFPYDIPSVEIVGGTNLMEEYGQSYITMERINEGHLNY